MLAPRALIATDPAGGTCFWLPPALYDRLDAIANRAGAGAVSFAYRGVPVFRLPEHLDERDRERWWREGRIRAE